MAVLPLDMTLIVQRTPEVNRTHANEAARPEVAHQQFAERLNRETQIQDQQVTQTNKTEENRVDQDGKGSGGYASRRKNKGKKEEKPAAPRATGSSSMFDVSI